MVGNDDAARRGSAFAADGNVHEAKGEGAELVQPFRLLLMGSGAFDDELQCAIGEQECQLQASAN